MKTETKCRIAACAAGFALPRYADLPQMGLYLDQTVQYVNSYFRTFCGVELTSSMVSNYVKKGILSHPVRKKYARDQIASLMYIAVSKTVLSMENIDALFKMQRAHCSAGAAYDYFCDEMENCLPFVFGCTREIRDLAVDAADEKLLLRSTILAAANKMYLDCCFNALRQEGFAIDAVTTMNKRQLRQTLSGMKQANIAVRNFPLSVAELRKRLKLNDGGDTYIFATTTSEGDHILMLTHKTKK